MNLVYVEFRVAFAVNLTHNVFAQLIQYMVKATVVMISLQHSHILTVVCV